MHVVVDAMGCRCDAVTLLSHPLEMHYNQKFSICVVAFSEMICGIRCNQSSGLRCSRATDLSSFFGHLDK